MAKCCICQSDSILKVAEHGNIDLFACCNESCINYAELLVESNGVMVVFADMMDAYRQVVKEITDEKNKIPKRKV